MSNNSIIEHRANYYFIELREEYLHICQNCSYKKNKSKASSHCKAFILAIMESWTNDKRGKGEDLAIYMTYPQWIEAMYGMFGRCVIIDSLEELIGESLLSREKHRMYGKDTYKYRLNCQELNRRVKLLPERDPKHTRPKVDASINRRDNSEDPSKSKRDTRLKVDEDPSKSRHNIESTKKPNIESKESTNANDSTKIEPDSLTHSSLQSSFAQEKYLSTPIVDKPVSDVDNPPETQLPIATVTTGNASIERHTEKLAPLGIYDEQEKQQHQWWCQLGMAVKVNLTNKGHWATLSEHVQSFEDMKSLYDFTEQQIDKDPGLDDKTVKPGNLANADNLNGWKKKKRKAEQPKDSSKSSSGSGMRNYTFDPEPQPTTQEPPSGELVAVPGFSLKAMREKLRKERANV
ncbi:MAG TPA: hypothetical protein VHV10_02455 [Ktedonobacteraceae bacterium]|jgi:hypothetical protein|nr:hypothetical protein [Ktedonobacteraceae bacterium]